MQMYKSSGEPLGDAPEFIKQLKFPPQLNKSHYDMSSVYHYQDLVADSFSESEVTVGIGSFYELRHLTDAHENLYFSFSYPYDGWMLNAVWHSSSPISYIAIACYIKGKWVQVQGVSVAGITSCLGNGVHKYSTRVQQTTPLIIHASIYEASSRIYGIARSLADTTLFPIKVDKDSRHSRPFNLASISPAVRVVEKIPQETWSGIFVGSRAFKFRTDYLDWEFRLKQNKTMLIVQHNWGVGIMYVDKIPEALDRMAYAYASCEIDCADNVNITYIKGAVPSYTLTQLLSMPVLAVPNSDYKELKYTRNKQ